VIVATDIIMPQLGESIAEGTVVKWLIPLGGAIEKDQSLLEVETEKVDLEVPSPASGVLNQILVKEGETVAVGTLLARIDSAPPSEVVNRVGGVVVRQLESATPGEEHHSPAVRQLAREHGVDLTQVQGTGAGGRVTKKDVLEFVARSADAGKAPVTGGEASMGEEIRPLTQMRKTIADRMLKSRQTSAHVSTFFEADFSGIAAYRAGRNLTYLPFVVRAVTRAMRDFPIVNSAWGDQGIVIKKDLHIGIATALEEGCSSRWYVMPIERDLPSWRKKSPIWPIVRGPRNSARMKCRGEHSRSRTMAALAAYSALPLSISLKLRSSEWALFRSAPL